MIDARIIIDELVIHDLAPDASAASERLAASIASALAQELQELQLRRLAEFQAGKAQPRPIHLGQLVVRLGGGHPTPAAIGRSLRSALESAWRSHV